MMCGKNHSGFSLIEALVAVAVAALIMTAIFGLQDTIVQSIGRASRNFDRIISAYQVLVTDDIGLKSGSTSEQKEHTVAGGTVKFVLQPLSDDSPLKKFPDLYREQATVTWYEGRRKRTDTLLTFVYRPEEPEKKPTAPTPKVST